MEANEVAVRPAKREVLLGNGSTYTYGSQAPPSPPYNRSQSLENSWKYSSQTMLPLIQSMYLNPPLMHLVYVISSPLSCGHNPVLYGLSAYQTCQQNLERLSVTNTSARSNPCLRTKRGATDKSASYSASVTTLSC